MKSEIIILNNKREIIILIKIDNKKFFISQFFINKTQILKFKYVLIIMRIINDYRIFLYKTHNLIFNFINNRKKEKKRKKSENVYYKYTKYYKRKSE